MAISVRSANSFDLPLGDVDKYIKKIGTVGLKQFFKKNVFPCLFVSDVSLLGLQILFFFIKEQQ